MEFGIPGGVDNSSDTLCSCASVACQNDFNSSGRSAWHFHESLTKGIIMLECSINLKSRKVILGAKVLNYLSFKLFELFKSHHQK